jgi:hypothetical protein
MASLKRALTEEESQWAMPPVKKAMTDEDSKWARWYGDDTMYWDKAQNIVESGLPCVIRVKNDVDDWGRITLVLEPQSG